MVCTVIWGVMTYCVLIDIFTIVPTTQYVWINKTATLRCATNVTECELGFSILGGIPHDTTVTDLSEGGGQLATTSFTVTSDNNGTRVRCLADDGTDVQLTAPVFAYVQGTVDHRIMVLTYCLLRSPIISSRSYSSTTRVQYIH